MDIIEKIQVGSGKPLTLEAVREQFCIADKPEALKKMSEQLESVWDIDRAAELTHKITERMDMELKTEGASWTPMERILWTVKEAFILGCLDMAEKMMSVNDMGYEALTGEGVNR